jgi:hypothetical protein
MRTIQASLSVIFALAISLAATTTAPSTAPSELEQLRARVRVLEAENAKLRAQLGIASAHTQPANADGESTITPETFFSGCPRETLVGMKESDSLRRVAFDSWVSKNRTGKKMTITFNWNASNAHPGRRDEVIYYWAVAKINGSNCRINCEFHADSIDRLLAIKDGTSVKISGDIGSVEFFGVNLGSLDLPSDKAASEKGTGGLIRLTGCSIDQTQKAK